MTAPLEGIPDLQGWKTIAAALGLPERTARDWEAAYARTKHPMPIERRRGHVYASSGELVRWWRRTAERKGRGSGRRPSPRVARQRP